MQTREQIISALENPGLIAVVRAKSADQVLPLAEALVAGGILAVEITMTTPKAIEMIRQATAALGSRALIGVGTVLDVETCSRALEAGAQFVVSPITRPALVPVAHQAGRPVMLGALTPTEAQTAYEAGSDFIKLFPADAFGPNYIKAIRAPLPHLRIVPTGGVDLTTIADFFKVGCTAVGVGSPLLTREILINNDWPALITRARQFVTASQAARK